MININLTQPFTLDAAELGSALASATPKDFAAFWLSFGQKVKQETLHAFAKEMTPDLGGKYCFRDLERFISYYEEVERLTQPEK